MGLSNCKRILQGEGVKSRVLQPPKKLLAAASFWGIAGVAEKKLTIRVSENRERE